MSVSPGPTPLVLVLIAGPQASGKSTLAAALSVELRRLGESVALVELDRIAAMALPTLPGWDVAHAIFESVTSQWARAPLSCVIAEGSGSAEEVRRLRAQAPAGVPAITVAVSAPFAVALARARADPSRGITRDHDFLSGIYERWAAERAQMDPDLQLDSGERSVEHSVVLVRAAIDAARAAAASSRRSAAEAGPGGLSR